MNWKLIAIQGVLIQENDWFLVRTVSFVAFSFTLVLSPAPQISDRLENNSLHSYTGKGGRRMDLICKEFLFVLTSGGSDGLSLSHLTPNLPSAKAAMGNGVGWD